MIQLGWEGSGWSMAIFWKEATKSRPKGDYAGLLSLPSYKPRPYDNRLSIPSKFINCIASSR